MALTRNTATSNAPVIATAKQVVSNTGIGRRTYARIPTVLEMPNLVQVQVESFKWFVSDGLRELLEEISPITDHHRRWSCTSSILALMSHGCGCPRGRSRSVRRQTPEWRRIYCRDRDLNYASPLRVSARLVMKETGEIKETGPDGIFLGDFPLMTTDGTFIINGAERVVVSQLVRSPGVYFEKHA